MGVLPDGLRSSPKNVTGAACVLPAAHPKIAATAVAAKNRFLMLIMVSPCSEIGPFQKFAGFAASTR